MSHVAKWYGEGLQALAAKQVDWVNDSVKVALTTVSYVPDQDNHTTFSQVTNEITGTGYTAGGVALAGKTTSYAPATNTQQFKASDAVWSGATLTGVRVAVIYDVTAGNKLLGYVVFDADQSVSSATFDIQWDATDGVLRLIAA